MTKFSYWLALITTVVLQSTGDDAESIAFSILTLLA